MQIFAIFKKSGVMISVGYQHPVVSLLSVVAFLVTLEDCVHPISESIQCEDWLKWEIFVPTHLAPTTINVQGKVPLA